MSSLKRRIPSERTTTSNERRHAFLVGALVGAAAMFCLETISWSHAMQLAMLAQQPSKATINNQLRQMRQSKKSGPAVKVIPNTEWKRQAVRTEIRERKLHNHKLSTATTTTKAVEQRVQNDSGTFTTTNHDDTLLWNVLENAKAEPESMAALSPRERVLALRASKVALHKKHKHVITASVQQQNSTMGSIIS
jgi:hypothetical protein